VIGMTGAADAPVTIETPVLDQSLCQGPCMTRYRETGKGVQRFGDPVLCQRDVSQLRNELTEIDTMAAVLVAGADGFRASTGSDAAIRAHRSAGSRPSPSPAHDLIDELTSVLRKYVLMKRVVAGRLGFVARDITELASWLITNLDRYVSDREVAGVLSADVHRWHGRLEKQTKSATALLHKPLPCPACKKQGLQQERGSKVVKCAECGLIRSIEDYEAMAADAVEATEAGKATAARPARRAAKTAAAAPPG
jgi:ribosomal protein L37AE/L43A